MCDWYENDDPPCQPSYSRKLVSFAAACGAVYSSADLDHMAQKYSGNTWATWAKFSLQPPSEWTCSKSYYGDDSCDCDCGAPDPDCTQNGDCGNWTWPDLSSTCDLLRANWVCSGHSESSCLTGAPYECVFAGNYCRASDAQYLALQGLSCYHDSSSSPSCVSDNGFDQECASRGDDCHSSSGSSK